MAKAYPQYRTYPRILPILALSSQITASTGSTCSTEPRNTPSWGSINVQNPKHCECTRSTGSIERWHTASTRSVSSIGPWQSVLRTRSVSMQYCPPKSSSQYLSYSEYTGSTLGALSICFSAASTRSMRALTAKVLPIMAIISAAYNPVYNPVYKPEYNPRILPILAVSS